MEIFNTDDYTEDSLEIDDNLVGGGFLEQTDESKVDKPKETDKPADKAEDDKHDEDKDGFEDDDLDLIIPPSDKSITDNKDVDDASSDLNPKFFSSLVKALVEGGILEDIKEDDIKSQEDFFKVFDEGVKQREFADLSDLQKEYLEALREGIPHEDISKYQRTINNYNSITIEAIEDDSENGEALRRNIILNNFLTKGITEAKANKLTDKIFDSGEDIQEAKDSIEELKTQEKTIFESRKKTQESQRVQQEKNEQVARETLNTFIKNTNEIIPGVTIPQNMKNKVIKGLTEPVAFTEDGTPLDIISNFLHNDPINGRAKLAYILAATDNMKNMSALENKKVKSTVMKDLEKALRVKENGGMDSTGNPSKWSLDDFDIG